MSLKWQRLCLSKVENIPPLLFKYSPTPTSYELYITDLTNVWSEHMNRQNILKRAEEIATTIDPSEDPEQFKLLLQKIEDALRNQPGSSTEVSWSSKTNSLELTITTELPSPFKPLKWSLYLSKEPQSSVTSQLFLPLVRAEADWESHQRTLIDQLHRKDWILGKLFDKIEAVGVDLSTIFPGTTGLRSGQKGTTLAQAAKYIKGVAPFDENAWFEEISKSSAGSGLAANILAEVSSPDNTARPGVLNPPPDKWWENFTTTGAAAASVWKDNCIQMGTQVSKRASADDTQSDTEIDDNEFEQQETPPGLRQFKNKRREMIPSRSKDKGADVNIPENSPSPKQKSPVKPSRGLGVIGGKTKTKTVQQPSPPSPHPTQTSHIDDDQTDSGTDSSPASSSPGKPLKKAPEKAPSKPRGLGVIGGRKKQKQATPTEPTSSPPVNPPKLEPNVDQPLPPLKHETKRAGKLGIIGGKAHKQTIDSTPSRKPEEDHDGRSSPPKNQTPRQSECPPSQLQPPQKEETEKERADRKREELKRQLDAKSKAPTKKKRKF
ncbi:XRCC4-like factor-domain-containing protein [Aspergillus avenaceus]|uniref:Non-homologous end-joining factor 1 n=1 Tax=Aspergillus avenaceus TaxID=36643 RepID=A0A5N6TGW6_ASPAV|nr:XRCC4-like factor-domain-containing protein [Aspergillus avenaceus]